MKGCLQDDPVDVRLRIKPEVSTLMHEDIAESKMVCNIDLCKIRPSVIQIWQIEQKITISNSRLLFRVTLAGWWEGGYYPSLLMNG